VAERGWEYPVAKFEYTLHSPKGWRMHQNQSLTWPGIIQLPPGWRGGLLAEVLMEGTS
jgi:hypothetical protein